MEEMEFQSMVTVIYLNDNDQKDDSIKSSVIYTCNYVICTLPLGVLKSNIVKFNPELPIKKQEAINLLGFGLMNKIVLKFKNNFWGSSVQSFNVSTSTKGKFPWFFVLNDKESVLCCFVTDDFAKEIEDWEDEKIINSITIQLKNTFRVEVSVIEYKITRWGKDEFALGSYSFFKYNSNPTHCDTLRENVDLKLFFAGEACYKNNLGVLHGAYSTGILAAEEIIKLSNF
jgi:monoamine oxidase